MEAAMNDTNSTSSAWAKIDLLVADRDSFVERVASMHGLDRCALRALAWGSAGAATFGAALGSYGESFAQVALAALKVPILVLGTAALCFPAFYVLQRLRASRPLSLAQAVAVQSQGLLALGLFWAAMALPVAFLVGTGEDYRLAQYLALATGTAGGVIGLSRVLSGFRHLAKIEGRNAGARFLLAYALLFALVGGQLAWMLRPFIGSPSLGFQLFRPVEGNILVHVLRLLEGR
jgi:hypothetical protein